MATRTCICWRRAGDIRGCHYHVMNHTIIPGNYTNYTSLHFIEYMLIKCMSHWIFCLLVSFSTYYVILSTELFSHRQFGLKERKLERRYMYVGDNTQCLRDIISKYRLVLQGAMTNNIWHDTGKKTRCTPYKAGKCTPQTRHTRKILLFLIS